MNMCVFFLSFFLSFFLMTKIQTGGASRAITRLRIITIIIIVIIIIIISIPRFFHSQLHMQDFRYGASAFSEM